MDNDTATEFREFRSRSKPFEDPFQDNDAATVSAPEKPDPDTAVQFFIAQLKQGIWWLGIPSWLFGMTDRGFAAFADGYLSASELFTVLVTSFLFVSWLSLKPGFDAEVPSDSALAPTDKPFSFQPNVAHLEATQARMAELNSYHLISQSYSLPYPYVCQIYHLLNLKHLETIHSFSLNNLKVVKVSSLEQTEQGGMITFQTVLDSPWNILRIWRRSMAEVQLTLHSPYTVELGIPVYGDKMIIVLFNAIPLSHTDHEFRVDIYSNLPWYKPVLQAVLHFATLLTLIEDLPYLKALAQTNVQRLFGQGKSLNPDMMWLFRRFVHLYGSTWSGSTKRALPAATEDSLP
ncbi:MAG: hypothetical protein IGS38_17875 [Synechococcales cyanobacterium M58_A2018_015]|nr:hypothetical protein [Synechococcales cyanobacterium M58_A2018_015]